MELLLIILAFAGALFVVVKSADYLVQFAAKIAKRFGVSEFVIGLTLVAVGTSLPELTNMIISSLRGINDFALGNVMGSNMANLGMSIGAALLVGGIRINPEIYQKEMFILFGTTMIYYVVARNGIISALEGFLFVSAFAAYTLYITHMLETFKKRIHPGELAHFIYHLSNVVSLPVAIKNGIKNGYSTITAKWEKELLIDAGGMIASGVVLIYAADILVERAISLATIIGVPSASVGATIVALGTSTPELSISIASVRKGYYNMLLGNLIGSNITNILLIIGLGAIIQPIVITTSMLEFVFPALIAATALFSFVLAKGGQTRKPMGFAFLGIYAAFLVMMWYL